MAIFRDNCIILIIEEPVPGRVPAELTGAFGEERASRINLDLLQNAYKLAKNFKDAILILSYDKSARYPDLTWLDNDDPGFLESKGKDRTARVSDAFRLAFNTGAKKALLLNHLSPAVKPEWLGQAFEAMNDKTLVLGLNQNGSAYLAGASVVNAPTLEGLGSFTGENASDLTARIKKNKLSVFTLPESYSVESEETLRRWMESRETPASILSRAAIPAQDAAAPRQESRKNGKRNSRNGQPQAAAPGGQEAN